MQNKVGRDIRPYSYADVQAATHECFIYLFYLYHVLLQERVYNGKVLHPSYIIPRPQVTD